MVACVILKTSDKSNEINLARDPRGYNIPKEEEKEEEEKDEREEKEGEKESEKINDYEDKEERGEMINAGVGKKDDGVKENSNTSMAVLPEMPESDIIFHGV
ncbi:hypothetical protein V1477_005332 [Vespula maculifrons]|uniref:Uncharacterized protein n=1 Tax=Vespula maculifrons TaxID=7453 RepID=A0ABD2CPF5_VESMC